MKVSNINLIIILMSIITFSACNTNNNNSANTGKPESKTEAQTDESQEFICRKNEQKCVDLENENFIDRDLNYSTFDRITDFELTNIKKIKETEAFIIHQGTYTKDLNTYLVTLRSDANGIEAINCLDKSNKNCIEIIGDLFDAENLDTKKPYYRIEEIKGNSITSIFITYVYLTEEEDKIISKRIELTKYLTP